MCTCIYTKSPTPSHFTLHYHSLPYCTCFGALVLSPSEFPSGIMFCVMEMPMISIHYVVSWIQVSFFVCAIVYCVCMRKLFNSEGLNRRAKKITVCVYVHIMAYFFNLRSRDSPSVTERAECVLWLSMEHLRDQIIAVSSASVPVWESYCIISQLFPASDGNIYMKIGLLWLVL